MNPNRDVPVKVLSCSTRSCRQPHLASMPLVRHGVREVRAARVCARADDNVDAERFAVRLPSLETAGRPRRKHTESGNSSFEYTTPKVRACRLTGNATQAVDPSSSTCRTAAVERTDKEFTTGGVRRGRPSRRESSSVDDRLVAYTCSAHACIF